MYNSHINNPELNNEIVIYKTPNREIRIEVRLANESVWLSQKQMAQLFGKKVPTINEHIKNVYKEKELDKSSTIRKFLIVQREAGRTVERSVEYYNIDVVISVGYRVKSVIGTQFRIWANKILKNYLLKGFTLNEKKLLEARSKFKELQSTISFMEDKSNKGLLSGQEGELLHLLSVYAKTLTLLEAYDSGKLAKIKGTRTNFLLTYKNCLEIVSEIKKTLVNKNEASDLFGSEVGNSFEGIIKGLYQTYAGKELYPNICDKASNLLYLIIKDHPFTDGNKRTAAFIFVYFLDKTNTLYRENGEKKINDNALTALALLVAESDPNEKEIMISIIKNLIVN